MPLIAERPPRPLAPAAAEPSAPPPKLSAADAALFREVVGRRSGNVLTERQSYLFEQKLGPLAAEFGLDGAAHIAAELRRTGSPTLEGRVAEALTINETSFFRDPTPFDAVREDVLPRLVQENAARREIRIWCGASSTGQEPYSLAILIREKFPQLATWNVRILATDIADSMLARTAAGTYSSLEMNRGMPASLCIRHFDRVGTAWRVKRHLRAMIEVQKLNLVGAWPPLGRFDLVLLRNVLIYFDPTTKEAVLNRVAAAMNPGGALLLGCTESVLGLKTPFRPEPNARTTVYRLA